MAAAVGASDKRLEQFIQMRSENGNVAELCGLWVADEIQGGAIKWALNAYALAAYPLLGVNTLIGFSSPHMLSFLQTLGWKAQTCVGEQGVFVYPSPGIFSTVMVHQMDQCPIAERQRILAIRHGRHLPFTFSTTNGQKYLLQLERIRLHRHTEHQTALTA
jgi:hypothetical protein